jgi:membrane-anchored mycosin MYCP
VTSSNPSSSRPDSRPSRTPWRRRTRIRRAVGTAVIAVCLLQAGAAQAGAVQSGAAVSTSTVNARSLSTAVVNASAQLSAGTAASPCQAGAATPGEIVRAVPWAQKWMDPDRLRPLATGAGQVVAVIDSGTDGTHRQLRGRVARGYDLLRDVPDNDVDCLSHGTAVASLIAGLRVSGIGLRGLAPQARILPVRVTDVDPATDVDASRQPTPAMLAAAIRWATAHGATVIDVSPTSALDRPKLRSAVKAALAAGVVVVAAAGDRHDERLAADPPTYPASYPGVIGVGAVDRAFTRVPRSVIGPQVLVTAPGDDVLGATRQYGHQTWSGTSISAAFVAGTAALVRQTWPDLTPQQVAARIAATADPAPGGQRGGYGAGIVDPYRAVTEPLAGLPVSVVPGLAEPHLDPAAQARARWRHRVGVVAMTAAGILFLALFLLTAAIAVRRRGRERSWAPTRAKLPRPDLDAANLDDADPFGVPLVTGQDRR